MRGVAPEHALQRLKALAGIGHAAARPVRQRDHAVDMRIGVERAGMVHPVGDVADHRRRAVHGRAERDEVARADAPVGAAQALEGRLRGVAVLHRPEVDADAVILVVLAHRAIVDMHMGAGRNVLRRRADDLAEFDDRLAGADGPGRDLVAHRHRARDGHALAVERRAGRQGGDRDDDVVLRVKPHEAPRRREAPRAGLVERHQIGSGRLSHGSDPLRIRVMRDFVWFSSRRFRLVCQ